jgi:flavin-dependent dehydrogenase
LVEREAFPRPHIGEALAPGILPLLESLGLEQRFEDSAAFLRPSRAVIRWTGNQDRVIQKKAELGFIVDRSRFDRLLLDLAVEAGVRAFQPASALKPVHQGRQQWLIPLKGAGAIRSNFFVDASGKSSALRRPKRRVSPPMLALCAYWRNVQLPTDETWVEAGPNGWFWGATLPDGSFSGIAFVDPEWCALQPQDLSTLYCSLIRESRLLRGYLDGTLTSEVRAYDASSYAQDLPIGEDAILVGEAGFSIDPLASQGVQAAMRSAIQGALAVHTILTLPGNAAVAEQFYCERHLEAVAFHREIAARYYSEHQTFRDNPFWRRRATSSQPLPGRREYSPNGAEQLTPNRRVRLSQAATLRRVPVAHGDVISETSALLHPALERPVAFLDAVEIAPLMSVFEEERTVAEIITIWMRRVDLQTARAILRWLWEKRIITYSE